MYAYSTDEERFHDGEFETPEAAAAEAFYGDDDLQTVWVGEVVKATAHKFVNAWRLEDWIAEEAFEEAGEIAESWITKVGLLLRSCDKELNKLIGDWIEEREPVLFFTVKDVQKFVREDVIEAGTLEADTKTANAEISPPRDAG